MGLSQEWASVLLTHPGPLSVILTSHKSCCSHLSLLSASSLRLLVSLFLISSFHPVSGSGSSFSSILCVFSLSLPVCRDRFVARDPASLSILLNAMRAGTAAL